MTKELSMFCLILVLLVRLQCSVTVFDTYSQLSSLNPPVMTDHIRFPSTYPSNQSIVVSSSSTDMKREKEREANKIDLNQTTMAGSKVVLVASAIAITSIILALNPPTALLHPPYLRGSYDHLNTSRIVEVNGAFGPESLAFDANGEGPYTGVADGRILKWSGEEKGWVDFAFTTPYREECVRPFAPEVEHVCGRPLGLRFDKKTGDLYIADAYFGLSVVGPEGGLAKPVVTEIDGQPFRFTNDMDIDEHEDVIYFTDTSTSFYRRQFANSIFSGDKTGRLMRYDRSSKDLKVLLRDLAFANGVALSKDHSFVLVAETTTCRIIRLWLQGPKAGKSEIFAKLPGLPDNIRRNSNGDFWVALHAKKGLFTKLVVPNRFAGSLLLKLPLGFKQLHSLLVGGKAHATAIKLNPKGEVLQILEDSEGKTLRFISEVEELGGRLWIGSVMMPFIGIYNIS